MATRNDPSPASSKDNPMRKPERERRSNGQQRIDELWVASVQWNRDMESICLTCGRKTFFNPNGTFGCHPSSRLDDKPRTS